MREYRSVKKEKDEQRQQYQCKYHSYEDVRSERFCLHFHKHELITHSLVCVRSSNQERKIVISFMWESSIGLIQRWEFHSLDCLIGGVIKEKSVNVFIIKVISKHSVRTKWVSCTSNVHLLYQDTAYVIWKHSDDQCSIKIISNNVHSWY